MSRFKNTMLKQTTNTKATIQVLDLIFFNCECTFFVYM